MHHWIAEPAALAARIAAWQGVASIALDTEFIRERTWWPQLALVQIAAPGDEPPLLVDATVAGMADALRPLLADRAIVKLMHSASEDIQALAHTCGAAPEPLFDTQIAAALTGVGVGMGYQKLVATLLGVELDKGQTRSDWLHRPLSAEQLAYAAADVAHLHALHAILCERLHALGRQSWLDEDCARLLASAGDTTPEAWPHLAMRGASFLAADAQARLCRLLRWRERQARAADRPKGWILDNELALALARRPPADRHGFHALLDASPKAPRRARGELWDVLSAPLGKAERDIPLATAIDGTDKQRLRALQDAIAAIAADLHIDATALASRRSLEALLNGDASALQGWRRAVLEPTLTPLLGNLAPAGPTA
ncbi:MAG: ribonuclease D [Proteobacteria bacterium]|nr:ribonuclease D [Pseudomonadota bacterium]